jgi:uncharacterized protein (UPF0261 family)
MTTAETANFPFVAELPKREQKKVLSAWDVLAEFQRLTEEHGVLVPPRLVAKCLSVSKQRVHQFMTEGRLQVIDVNGHPFVTKNSVVAFAETERKGGRPQKVVRLSIKDNLMTGGEVGMAMIERLK